MSADDSAVELEKVSLSETNQSTKTKASFKPNKISQSSSNRPKHFSKPCKYKLAQQTCPFGSKCRYSHELVISRQSTNSDVPSSHVEHSKRNKTKQAAHGHEKHPTVCRHHLKGDCRYSAKCVYRHPDSSDCHIKTRTQTNTFDTHERSKRTPSELNLGSFLAPQHARPPVQRPKPKKANKMSSAELREVELEQLEARFPDCLLLEKGKDRSVYQFTYQPADPEWDFSLKELTFEVAFPSEYPDKPLSVKVAEHERISTESLVYINDLLQEYISSQLSGVGQLMFRPFLHWIDKSVMGMLRQVMIDKLEADVFLHSDSESGSWTNSESCEEEHSCGSDVEGQLDVSLPRKSGTEIRLIGLNISQSVATVTFSTPKLVVGCTRCKAQEDVRAKPDSPISGSCSRCHSTYSVVYHPSLVHASSTTVGYMDLLGCSPLDLILLDCTIRMACLECGHDNETKTMLFGQSKEVWCRKCHSKLSIVAEQSKFVQHQAFPIEITGNSDIIPKKKHHSKGETIFKIGSPLPDFGTCVHYKKSHRWLRFPCCGKVYPCDNCHDSSESHVMERATRMVCGFCSKEQVYTSTKPCTGCGSDMASIKHTSYWEGGGGCRSKVKMNRNDRHKFSNSSTKTASQKSKRVGKKEKTKSNK